MKNKILFLIIAAVGALLITASNGFSHNGVGNDVNVACYPTEPYTGECSLCHLSDREASTPAKEASKAGGTTLTDYFCPSQPACNDNDGDGYGDPGDSSCTYTARDCDDTNASRNPGNTEKCNDGIDNDCDFLIDGDDPDCPVIVCTDSDKDDYNTEGVEAGCGPVDCNDNDAFINPGEQEDCTNDIDNNCNGLTGFDDPDCPAEFCTDYKDRRSCKADPRCNYSGGKESGCSEIPAAQLNCEADGGRWNKKKETCTIR